MALSLSSIMIGSSRPKALAAFYETVLAKAPDMAEDGWYGWSLGGCFLMIGRHSEVKGKAKEPQRLMLNFQSRTARKDAARIKAAGAKVIKDLYQMEGAWIATFADPDGNFFQVMSPWKG